MWTNRTLPPGEAGIWTTLRAIRDATRQQAADPGVREAAHAIVAGCGPNDSECRGERIIQWVRERLAYVPDPVEVEALSLATSHLRRISESGTSAGDCDDATVLIATLARAVGIPVRITVASFRDSKQFHHVWPDLVLGGSWKEADIFRSERFSLAPTRVMHVPV